VTNHGTRAILGLPKMPERQLQLLLALETFTPRDDGWREVGTKLLASTAGLSATTATRARRDLVKSGAIEYERGDGKGHLSTYRIKVPHGVVHLPEPGKVVTDGGDLKGGHNADDLKGGHNADDLEGGHIVDDLSGPGKVVTKAPERSPNSPRKGSHRNPATSGNAIGALEALALEPSALPRGPRAARDPRDLLLGLGADEREIELIIARLEADPDIHHPWVYLLTIVGNDDGPAWLDRMRRDLDGHGEHRPPRPAREGLADVAVAPKVVPVQAVVPLFARPGGRARSSRRDRPGLEHGQLPGPRAPTRCPPARHTASRSPGRPAPARPPGPARARPPNAGRAAYPPPGWPCRRPRSSSPCCPPGS